MGKVKILTAREAADLVQDNDMLTMSGFLVSGVPEALAVALEERFLETGSPKNLTYHYIAGQGQRDGTAGEHFAHEGMVKRVIGGHYNFLPNLTKMITDNKIEGYNVPQGVAAHMLRDSAAHRIGSFTTVGLHTFADPRNGGGKLNDITKEDIVKIIEIEGQEQLFYPRISIDVAFIKGTYADEFGNVTLEKEVGALDATAQAMAVKNNGGKVIVQVEKVVKAGVLDPKLVKIPGIYVEAVVVCEDDNQAQSLHCKYDPSLSGEVQVPTGASEAAPLDAKKIIGRRGAMELKNNIAVNLGVGVPEYVAAVAEEEGIGDAMTLTVEAGPIGGIPQGGLRFGSTRNAQAFLDEPYQFDFYDGGGLDLCYLGLAQVDDIGNVDVSRFGTKIAGSGGFTNISTNSKKAVFCGTFTNGGLKIKTGDGKLEIVQEGRDKKFIKVVDEITFSGLMASKQKKNVLYVTERAVFELKEDGIHLAEVAPGIDIQTQILDLMEFKPIMDNVKTMDERIFKDEIMGLTL